MHTQPTAWRHVMLHDLPACACVRVADGRHYARVACPDCNGAGVLRTADLAAVARRALTEHPDGSAEAIARFILQHCEARAAKAEG